MTYQMKNILQISDLKTVFDAIDDTEEGLDFYYKHYSKIQVDTVKSIEESISKVKESSEHDRNDNKQLLEQIMKLTIEADMRKRIAEKLIDQIDKQL